MKKSIKILIIVVSTIVVIITAAKFMMRQSVNNALKKQVNVEIDMNKVKDGTYIADSDGGMVKVQVRVEVKDHKIKDIELLKHENGKGKPAEVIIDDMIQQNTDNVDGVSGETTSSKTIRNAVNKALQQGLE